MSRKIFHKAVFQMRKRCGGKNCRRQCFQIPGKFMQSIKLQKQISFETRCFWNVFVSEYLFHLRNFQKHCRGKHCRGQCFEIPWKCIQLQIRRHSKQKCKFIWFSHASLISHIHYFDSTFPEFENIAAGNVFLGNVFSSETQPYEIIIIPQNWSEYKSTDYLATICFKLLFNLRYDLFP